jgi:response regulator RpfG family c-di-GMP phosphodiesterase
MGPLQVINVLLVEDEYINAWALANALKPYCNIRHAGTRDEAMYWVSREKFDFILLDIHLGQFVEAGIEMLPKIKEIQPSCRVFATTGYGTQKDEARFLGLGFDSFYPKPVDEQKIMEEIIHFGENQNVA